MAGHPYLQRLVALAATLSFSVYAGAPTPEMLSFQCSGCHGVDGSSVGLSMPSLAGQPKDAIVGAMKSFKSGERPATVMGRLAKGYSDPEIDAMGDFFSKQARFNTVQQVDEAKAAKGLAVAQKQCAKCHKDKGRAVSTDDTPVVGGQWLKYLQIQFDEYQSGKRKASENMANRLKQISAEDMDNLAHFYAGSK